MELNYLSKTWECYDNFTMKKFCHFLSYHFVSGIGSAFILVLRSKTTKNIQYYILIVVRMYLGLYIYIYIYEVFFYLFHEGLAQTHNLGKKNGIVGEMRAQVAEHAECIPA